MQTQELIRTINDDLSIELPEEIGLKEVRMKLQTVVNHLIQNDFPQLVSLLYRLDINEEKLKFFLQEKVSEEAGMIIADLIIERQLQKIKSRHEFRHKGGNISEDESW